MPVEAKLEVEKVEQVLPFAQVLKPVPRAKGVDAVAYARFVVLLGREEQNVCYQVIRKVLQTLDSVGRRRRRRSTRRCGDSTTTTSKAWGRATLRATIDVEEEAFLLLLSLSPPSFLSLFAQHCFFYDSYTHYRVSIRVKELPKNEEEGREAGVG